MGGKYYWCTPVDNFGSAIVTDSNKIIDDTCNCKHKIELKLNMNKQLPLNVVL
jgi:hypothetical protein